MWWFRLDVDAELNKVDAAKPATTATQVNQSSKHAVSDTVETAGFYICRELSSFKTC